MCQNFSPATLVFPLVSEFPSFPALSLPWLNFSLQLITTQPLAHSPSLPFFPFTSLSSPTPTPSGMESWRGKNVKVLGWGKNTLITETKENIIILMLLLLFQIIIEMTDKKRGIKPKRNKCTTQFLTACWPTPNPSLRHDQWLLASFPQLYPGMMFYDRECPLGQFRSAVPVTLPHSFLCICLVADHRTLKSVLLMLGTI